jgi:hypothetical protein
LRNLRIRGALGAAPARSSDLDLAVAGDVDFVVDAAACSMTTARPGLARGLHRAAIRACKPVACRHRRRPDGRAPGSA